MNASTLRPHGTGDAWAVAGAITSTAALMAATLATMLRIFRSFPIVDLPSYGQLSTTKGGEQVPLVKDGSGPSKLSARWWPASSSADSGPSWRNQRTATHTESRRNRY